MKKKVLLVAAIILALGGSAGAYYGLQKDDTKNEPTPAATTPEQTSQSSTGPSNTPAPGKPSKACDILTPEVATSVLGAGAKASDSNNEAPKDADHTIITTCTYSSLDGTKSASLLMRVAKDAEGSAHDKEQFGIYKPANAETVDGYGDSAYWDANFRQLNILKGTTWYIITNGPTEVSSRTLEQAKQLGSQILTKL